MSIPVSARSREGLFPDSQLTAQHVRLHAKGLPPTERRACPPLAHRRPTRVLPIQLTDICLPRATPPAICAPVRELRSPGSAPMHNHHQRIVKQACCQLVRTLHKPPPVTINGDKVQQGNHRYVNT